MTSLRVAVWFFSSTYRRHSSPFPQMSRSHVLLVSFFVVFFAATYAVNMEDLTFETALTTAWMKARKSTIIANVTDVIEQTTNVFFQDTYYHFLDDSNLLVPPRVKGSRLDNILTRGVVNICDVAVEFLPWVQSANASGIGAGAGVSGDSLTATINELNKMYGTDVKQNFTLKETSAECLEIMNNTNSAEFFAFYAGPGALYNRQRRNILLQPFAMTACDTSLISIRIDSGASSVTQLSLIIDDNSVLCASGEASRQQMQSIFPQATVINIEDYEAIGEALLNGTCLAAYEIIESNETIQFSAGVLSPGTALLKREKLLDPRDWQGNEQFALAYEAALSEIAFSGARRIALAQIPFLTYNGECFLSTVTFQYPEPIPDGTLDRVLKNGTVRVGEVAADVNSGLAPWFIPSNSSTPSGAVHRFLSSLFGTMSINYNLLKPIQITYVSFASPALMLAALDRGEIEMTSPFYTGYNAFNGTYDSYYFRTGCSMASLPYVWYTLKGVNRFTNNTVDLSDIARAAAPGSITVAIHEQVTAEFVRTGVVYYPAFKFVLYPSIQDALNAVRDGLAPLALLPTNNMVPSSVAGFPSTFYRSLTPMFRKDSGIPKPLFTKLYYIHWDEAAAIVLIVLTCLIALVSIASFCGLIVFANAPAVRMSPPPFLIAVLVGSLLALAMMFTYIGKLKDASCILRPWFGGLGFAAAFTPMIAKQYRFIRILRNTALIQTAIPLSQLFLVTGALTALEVLLLILWTAIPATRLHASVRIQNGEAWVSCSADKLWPFLGLQLGYIILIVLAGIVFSVMTQKEAGRVLYQEPRYVNYSMINAVIWLVLFALATGLMERKVQYIVSVIAIIFMSGITAALIFLPKLRVVYLRKDGKEDTQTSVDSMSASVYSTQFTPDTK